MSIDQNTFNRILHAAMRAHDVDPEGSGGVPFDKMPLIAADVRDQIDRIGITDDELHTCFNWLLPEVMDRSMTPAGVQMAVAALGKGFGFKITLPN